MKSWIGNMINQALSTSWHPNCLTCNHCDQPVADKGFSKVVMKRNSSTITITTTTTIRNNLQNQNHNHNHHQIFPLSSLTPPPPPHHHHHHNKNQLFTPKGWWSSRVPRVCNSTQAGGSGQHLQEVTYLSIYEATHFLSLRHGKIGVASLRRKRFTKP